MHVSIVIPNYNGKQLLSKNLPFVLSIKGITDIVVVDDGSTDGSSNFLKKNYSHVKVIEKVTNSGFATSVNLGVKAANGDVVILLNTDVIPKRDFLKYLIPHFTDANVFAVGCLDESIEANKMLRRGRGIGTFRQGFLVHGRGEIDQTDTLWVAGGSGAFRKSEWEKLGGMDSLYDPFYWEDIDLSYRAQKAGYKVHFEPRAIVEHRHGEGAIKSHFTKTDIATIAYRNQVIFVWKNITDFSLMIEHLFWLPYHILIALWKRDTAFVKGLLTALIKLPEILRVRRLQAHSNTRTDRQVLAPYGNE